MVLWKGRLDEVDEDPVERVVPALRSGNYQTQLLRRGPEVGRSLKPVQVQAGVPQDGLPDGEDLEVLQDAGGRRQ